MIPNLPKPEIKMDLSTKVFIRENVLSNEECDELINSQVPNLHSSNLYKKNFASNFYSCLLPLDHHIHTTLQPVFAEMIEFLNIDVDFVEPYEIKRYTKQDYFSEHYDNYYFHKDNIDRKITGVILLSDPSSHTGGSLRISGTHFRGTRGSMIAFPSFLPHAVEPIVSGERWSLISWFWGSYWK